MLLPLLSFLFSLTLFQGLQGATPPRRIAAWAASLAILALACALLYRVPGS